MELFFPHLAVSLGFFDMYGLYKTVVTKKLQRRTPKALLKSLTVLLIPMKHYPTEFQ